MTRARPLAFGAAVGALLLGCSPGPGVRDADERVRYLRPSGQGRVLECAFTVRRGDGGWSISGVTERGRSTLTVSARYGPGGLLAEAEAALTSASERKAARVSVASGKARVEAPGRPPQEFDVPPGVVVTSAPDWTDTFLLCRLREPGRGGPQEFPGLWIHPLQPAQRLTLAVEKVGVNAVEHRGRTLELDRLALRLRGNSRYVAWADSEGRMIKLVSLPFKDGGTDLVREGFETSAGSLRPD